MSISVRQILSKLTALALATTGATGAPSADAQDLEDDRPIDLTGLHPAPRAEPAGSPPHASLTLGDPERLAITDAAAELGRGLALALERMRPIAATYLASTWALSAEPVRRLAIANALEWVFPLVGDSMVIDHLARDPDPAIRVAAARAAWSRRVRGGDPGVLARLSDDPDPWVRAVAAAAR